MKKSFWLGCLVLMAATFYSCKPSNTPSKVAEDFASAMLHNDYTKAKTLVTESDKAMLDQGEAMAKSNPMPDSLKTILNEAKITADNEKIENDTSATVDVKTTLKKPIAGRTESSDTYVLKKVGSEWKVDMAGTIKKVMESYGGSMAPEGADSSMADDSSMQSMPPVADTAASPSH